jgi:hypothetical protein
MLWLGTEDAGARLSESALERMLRYILNADSNVSLLRERIRKIRSKPLQSKSMTIADQLRQEGRQEGVSQGEIRAFRTAVIRTLEIRHGSCPEGIREALEAVQDPGRLEQLHERAMRSESIEGFARML